MHGTVGFISKRLTQVGCESVRNTFCSVSFWRRWRSISASRSTSSILRLRVRLLRCFDEVCMDASLLLSDEMDSERFLHPMRKWEASVSTTKQHNTQTADARMGQHYVDAHISIFRTQFDKEMHSRNMHTHTYTVHSHMHACTQAESSP